MTDAYSDPTPEPAEVQDDPAALAEAELHAFIIRHTNEHGHEFHTRVMALNEDEARSKLTAAHTDNTIEEVFPPERTNPPTDEDGGHPTVVDLDDEP